ncbi:MAG TPA: ribosome silencing factor [Vicinamibacterales bacterium]|nr:ribosome silencing factor [Vicinamibacterales bacterium]
MKKPERKPRKRPASPRLSTELTLGIAAALEKKAADVLVLDLRKSSAFTDFFVICTGQNVRQVHAISDAIQEALGKRGVKPAIVEGKGRAEWVLIDYFDCIFHVFTPGSRDFYGLERLWGDAERIEVSAT